MIETGCCSAETEADSEANFRCVVVGELGNEAELPEKLSSNLDSDRQVEVTDFAEPELIDPVPENIEKVYILPCN